MKWSDNRLYKAAFKGVNVHRLYKVEFDDGSLVKLSGKFVWPEGCELPDKVKNKLSMITDTKGIYQTAFENPDLIEPRTRKAPPRYIRDDDFIFM